VIGGIGYTCSGSPVGSLPGDRLQACQAASVSHDVVDASVVEGALRRGDLIVSSGEGDLAAIAAAAGRHIDIDHP
jgi:hypothetical protein